MKLGFSTIGCPEWKWSEIVDAARDMCIDGIEIRGVEEELNALLIRLFNAENAENTMSGLNSLGIEIPMLSTSVALGKMQDEKSEMEEAKKHIDFASRLKISYIRVLIDSKPEPTEADIVKAKERYRELCRYAEGKHVCVLVETNGLLADSKRMAEFLDGINSEARGVLWDIHHPYRYYHETPEETFSRLKNDIKYVHVKDSAMHDGKLEYRMMGFGDVPVFDAVKLLHQNGYEGYLTLEWVKRWHPTLRDPDVVFYHYQTYMETLLSEIELGA